MTTFLSNILSRRGLESVPAPLWKLKLSDTEYDELKQTLVDIFNRDASFDKCPKEAALFYAEWWKRNNGEGPDEPFYSLGIGENEEACKDLLKNAKRIFPSKTSYVDKDSTILDAKLVKTKRGLEYKYSLFYQGGIPMGRVCSGIGNGRKWDSFIQKFILNKVDLDDMPGAIIARKALKEYKNSLVDAGREHRPEGMPFACHDKHEWYLKVINAIKEVDKQRELHPFRIKWFYKRNPRDFSIKCNILGPSILSTDYIAQHKELEAFDSLPVQLFIGDDCVSTIIEYQKEESEDGIRFSSYYDLNQTIDYDGHSKISLRIPGVNSPILVSEIDMSSPLCFYWTSGEKYEKGSKLGDFTSVIVFNDEWILEKAIGQYTSLHSEFLGQQYTILTIRDNEDNIEFHLKNTNTGIPKIFSSDVEPTWTKVQALTKYSDYVVEELVDLSNEKQCQVLYFRSEEEDGIVASQDQIVYRCGNKQKWDNTIPFGKVECTVVNKDGEYYDAATELYSVGPNFIVKAERSLKNECHYRVSWDKGEVFPVADIKPTTDGLWIFKKEEFEDVIPFRCIPNNQNEQPFTIRIKAIYKDFAIFSPSGEKIENFEVIPWDDINSYRYRVNGETTLAVSPSERAANVYSVNGANSVKPNGIPEEGTLGHLITPKILNDCFWRAEQGYDFRIRYCNFTLALYPIKLDFDLGNNCLIPSLSIGCFNDGSYPDEYIENRNRIITLFKGHLYLIDVNGNILHDIARDVDGTYHLPMLKEKVFVICNQRGYIRPFILNDGIITALAAITNGNDSFENICLDHINWEHAERYLDTGLRYGIPLQNLPWISEIIKNPAYILALYTRFVIKSGNNPLKLYEAKSKMAAAMSAGKISSNDFGEDALNYLFASCQEGIYAEEYQRWLATYGYTMSSTQTWIEYIMWAAGKVQSLMFE